MKLKLTVLLFAGFLGATAGYADPFAEADQILRQSKENRTPIIAKIDATTGEQVFYELSHLDIARLQALSSPKEKKEYVQMLVSASDLETHEITSAVSLDNGIEARSAFFGHFHGWHPFHRFPIFYSCWYYPVFYYWTPGCHWIIYY